LLEYTGTISAGDGNKQVLVRLMYLLPGHHPHCDPFDGYPTSVTPAKLTPPSPRRRTNSTSSANGA
jgi:hypothetical protein